MSGEKENFLPEGAGPAMAVLTDLVRVLVVIVIVPVSEQHPGQRAIRSDSRAAVGATHAGGGAAFLDVGFLAGAAAPLSYAALALA